MTLVDKSQRYFVNEMVETFAKKFAPLGRRMRRYFLSTNWVIEIFRSGGTLYYSKVPLMARVVSRNNKDWARD